MYARQVGPNQFQNCWSLEEATHYWAGAELMFQPLTNEMKHKIREQSDSSGGSDWETSEFPKEE